MNQIIERFRANGTNGALYGIGAVAVIILAVVLAWTFLSPKKKIGETKPVEQTFPVAVDPENRATNHLSGSVANEEETRDMFTTSTKDFQPGQLPPADTSRATAVKKKKTWLNTERQGVVVRSNEVNWDDPEKKSTPDILNPSESVTVYRVGTITHGSLEGYSIYLRRMQEMMDVYDRFLMKGDEVIFLGKYSSSSNESLAQVLNIPIDNQSVMFDDTIVFEDLEFPTLLNGPAGQVLKREDDTGLFSDKLLTSSFQHQAYGTVWTTDLEKKKEYDEHPERYNGAVNQYLFRTFGFYVRAKDGTTAVYSLDVKDDALFDIIWNDRSKVSDEDRKFYSVRAMTGCGRSSFENVVSSDISELQITGENALGQPIYEPINRRENERLNDLYESRYWGENNVNKISLDAFVKQHQLIFVKDSFGRLVEVTSSKYAPMAECGKPVIYLYPTETTEVSVQVTPKGGMTVSIPDYNSGWQVTAHPDGRLINKTDGQEYPYLFWEGRGGLYQMPKKGFVIAKQDLDRSIREKLSQVGLIEQEINDFLEFWLPRMEKENKPFYFVTFMGNQTMHQIAPLDISPRPDTVIRVLMDYQGLDAPISVEPQTITTPARDGFTVVEWGGVLH